MNDEKNAAIKRALVMLCKSHTVKPTIELFSTWKAAVDILTIEQIGAATGYCLQKRSDAFMPTTGQFIEISEQIESEKKKAKRLAVEIAEQNKQIAYNPVGAEKVQKIVGGLAKTMQSEKKKKYEPPKITIYEYISTSGRVKSYQAKGKHESEFFKEQVFKTFGARPHNVQHKSKIFEAVKPNEPKDSRYYNTYRECSDSIPGAEIFTVGYA